MSGVDGMMAMAVGPEPDVMNLGERDVGWQSLCLLGREQYAQSGVALGSPRKYPPVIGVISLDQRGKRS